MSVLRRILSSSAINHLVRNTARVVLPKDRQDTFDRRLPLIDNFDVRLPNGRILHWSPQGDIVSKWIKYDGWNGYEPTSTQLFYTLAQHSRVVFDVGAYLGYFALLGAAAREGNQAFAFEAVPKLAECCRKIAAMNPDLRVEVISAAVCRTTGTIDLYLGDGDAFKASDTSTSATFRPNRKATKVDAIGLDEFIQRRGIPRVDLMKIDTETTEPEVLAGMRACIARWKPTILIEVLNVAPVDQLQSFLDENDYACAWVTPDGLLHRDRLEADPTCKYPNYLFYARDGSTEVAAAAKAMVRFDQLST